MKPHDVLYLKINDGCEHNLPYPQSALPTICQTHNLGLILNSLIAFVNIILLLKEVTEELNYENI